LSLYIAAVHVAVVM